MNNLVESKRSKFVPTKQKYRKGDYVRVKNFRSLLTKKFDNPFRDEINQILKVRCTDVLELIEVVQPGFQSNMWLIHSRFVKKISLWVDNQNE